MKVTLVIGSLSGGGAERVVCNLANYLTLKKHEVDILTVSDEITYKPDDAVNVVCMYGESKSRLPHASSNILRIFNFNKYLRRKKPDVYVTFLPKLTIILIAQRRFFKAPVIIAERCDPNEFCSRSAVNKKKWNRYYSKADGYVFQTEDAQKFYREHDIDVTNTVVIPNAINPDFIRDEYKGERDKTIVSAGRMTDQKNFSLLIKAFANVANDFPEYTLTIYGQGPLLESHKKLAVDLGIQKRVIFPGYVNDLGDRVQKASLFILSSNFEGMPNALMEAMALGLPCVSTDCDGGGAKFLIEDGVNGLLVPTRDVQALSEAIKCVLSNKENASTLGLNAMKIKDRLSSNMIYKQWEQYIEYIVKK